MKTGTKLWLGRVFDSLLLLTWSLILVILTNKWGWENHETGYLLFPLALLHGWFRKEAPPLKILWWLHWIPLSAVLCLPIAWALAGQANGEYIHPSMFMVPCAAWAGAALRHGKTDGWGWLGMLGFAFLNEIGTVMFSSSTFTHGIYGTLLVQSVTGIAVRRAGVPLKYAAVITAMQVTLYSYFLFQDPHPLWIPFNLTRPAVSVLSFVLGYASFYIPLRFSIPLLAVYMAGVCWFIPPINLRAAHQSTWVEGTGSLPAQFTLVSPQGDTLRKDAFRNKIVYMDFWTWYCKPCLESMPVVAEVRKAYATQSDIAFVSIHPAGGGSYEDFLQARGFHAIDMPHYYEPGDTLGPHFQIQGFPTGLLIDKHGQLRYRMNGWGGDWEKEPFRHDLIAAIEELRAEP